jgi:hypothetical protein
VHSLDRLPSVHACTGTRFVALSAQVTRGQYLALIAGMLTALVGVVHVGAGVRQYDWPSFDALWFYGTGMALLLAGALTTLASSSRAWRVLGVVALAANLLGLCLALAFGTLSHWREPQGPVLIALFVTGALGCVPALRQP